MAQESGIKTKRKFSYKLLIAIVFLLIFIIIGGLFYFQYMFFKSKAEGIAVGYARAAASAFQMGRPIPNTIFEIDNYRVEIVSTQQAASGQPFNITVNVKDRYTNITHYTYNSNDAGQSGQPSLPIPSAP